MYRDEDKALRNMREAVGKALESPDQAARFVAAGFTSQLDRMNAALERGDPLEAGAGLGNFTMSVAMMAKGGSGGKFQVAPTPSMASVATAGLDVVMTAPPAALEATVLMAANATAQKGSGSGGSKPGKTTGATPQEPAKPPKPTKTPANRRPPGTTLPPGEHDLRPGKEPQGEFDIDDYIPADESRKGDLLDQDELWQNSDLVERGVAPKRGVGASRQNPSVALGKEMHKVATAEQRATGLFDEVNRAGKSVREVIELNAEIRRKAGVPDEVVRELRKSSLRFAAERGEISAKELARIAKEEGWDRTLDLGK
jgi:hypothetical protein